MSPYFEPIFHILKVMLCSCLDTLSFQAATLEILICWCHYRRVIYSKYISKFCGCLAPVAPALTWHLCIVRSLIDFYLRYTSNRIFTIAASCPCHKVFHVQNPRILLQSCWPRQSTLLRIFFTQTQCLGTCIW